MNRRELLRGAAVWAGSSLMAPLASEAAALQPYRLKFGKDRVADLHRRIDATIWPPMPFDTGFTAGTSDTFLRDLTRYWREKYDWIGVQADLNRLTHLRGPVGGDDLHCVVFRGKGTRQPYPLILLHGWCGSFLEFIDAAPLLVEAGFDVVVPSLPGYTLSAPPRLPGMTISRMAERMHMLMRDLGYDRYGVQGGDWGSFVSTELALQQPESVVALHLNWAPTSGSRPPAATSPEGRPLFDFYGDVHRTTPQSLAYALQDSPVGALGWIAWRYWRQTPRPDAETFWKGRYRDRVLTTVMLYWLPRSIYSASRLYWESPVAATGRVVAAGKVMVPTGYSRFGGSPPREAVEPNYNLVHYTEPARGGHFAALEEPEIYAKEVGQYFDTQFRRPA